MYFQNVGTKPGLNQISEHPCDLLDFSTIHLKPDEKFAAESGNHELLIVVLSGKVSVAVNKTDLGLMGGRANVFEGLPYSVYVPPGASYSLESNNFTDIAVTGAPSESKGDPFVIQPDEVETGTWGAQNFTRYFRKILVNPNPNVGSLIVGETITPSGNWSSFPPHKHEADKLPHEVFAEEIYYFKVDSPEGYGLTYHYTDDGSIDNAYVVLDETILFIPKGYHTVVSAPGYTTYYLWALAGNHRVQAVSQDPHVGWVKKAEKLLS